MSQTVEAVYENGVLRPLEPLGLQEQQRVTVTVEEARATPSDEQWLEGRQPYTGETDGAISLEAVRKALSKIPGSLTEDFVSEREER